MCTCGGRGKGEERENEMGEGKEEWKEIVKLQQDVYSPLNNIL